MPLPSAAPAGGAGTRPGRQRSPQVRASSCVAQLLEPSAEIVARFRRTGLANERDMRGDPKWFDGDHCAGNHRHDGAMVVEAEKNRPAMRVESAERAGEPQADSEGGDHIHRRDDERADENKHQRRDDFQLASVARDAPKWCSYRWM